MVGYLVLMLATTLGQNSEVNWHGLTALTEQTPTVAQWKVLPTKEELQAPKPDKLDWHVVAVGTKEKKTSPLADGYTLAYRLVQQNGKEYLISSGQSPDEQIDAAFTARNSGKAFAVDANGRMKKKGIYRMFLFNGEVMIEPFTIPKKEKEKVITNDTFFCPNCRR